MIGKHTITYKAGKLETNAQGLAAEIRNALKAAIQLWQKDFLKYHFGLLSEVQGRYGNVYQARTEAYQKRKDKKYGHQDILVYSGVTRANALFRPIDVRVSATGARGILSGINAVNFNAGTRMDGQQRPDARAEILTLSPAELVQLQEFIQKKVGEFLQAGGIDETVQIA